MIYDTIIIGNGPAGISASLYTARSNLNTIIIGKEYNLLSKATSIENYYGFANGISGKSLLDQGELQAKNVGATLIRDEVVSIDYKETFHVSTLSKQIYKGRTVLIASGKIQSKLDVDGILEFEGRGVSYCSVCDGFFYRNLKVGVIGFKDFAIHEAMELKSFTKDITIFTNGKSLEISEESRDMFDEFNVDTKPIRSVEGADELQFITFIDGSKEKIDGLFIAYGSASSTSFAKRLGISISDDGYILTNNDQRTNLPGVFAAGDCTDGIKQISVAVGQGTIAGLSIIKYLKSIKSQKA